MRKVNAGNFLLVGTLLVAAQAHALKQTVHYQIAFDSCRAAGAPDVFCEEVGKATHNVDSAEFNTLSAHSQMENGQTACDGANAAVWRVFWLGGQMRQIIGEIAYNNSKDAITALAGRLGQALHTVQDNCAHSGMPNPQHAWWSVNDFCHGTSTSPDLVPEAATCAREETDAVMDAVFSALSDWGADKSALGNLDEQHNHLTGYGDACNFLGEASDWDGVDRRWDNTIVRPYMRNELVAAITTDNAQHGWICDAAPDGLLIGYNADVDTSGGAPSCLLAHTVCLGKADEIGPAPTSTKASSGGCDVSGSHDGDLFGLFAMVALAVLLRRRSITAALGSPRFSS
jgi:hypothetical protein